MQIPTYHLKPMIEILGDEALESSCFEILCSTGSRVKTMVRLNHLTCADCPP